MTDLKLEALIGRANLGRSEVLQIADDLSQEEIGILIAKLHDLKKAIGEKAAHDTSEIASTAQGLRQFSLQGIPSCMSDFYDSEISAVHIVARRTLSEIDQTISILAEISGLPADSCEGRIVVDAQSAYFWPD